GGCGRAEALVAARAPARCESIGQRSWRGRLYGRGVSLDCPAMHGRVYQGVWGTAPFQSLYESRNSRWSMALAPEWYLMIALLAGMFLLSLGWGASIVVGPILLVAIVLPIAQASISARRANFVAGTRKPWWSLLGLRVVVLILHLLQPMARLRGRIRGGLTPWRRRGPTARPRYRRLEMTYWRDKREAPEETLRKLQAELLHAGAIARAGGEFDYWDLDVLGAARWTDASPRCPRASSAALDHSIGRPAARRSRRRSRRDEACGFAGQAEPSEVRPPRRPSQTATSPSGRSELCSASRRAQDVRRHGGGCQHRTDVRAGGISVRTRSFPFRADVGWAQAR